ncbi:AAA family ATPase [Streptomyces sp. NPDC059382]|uniref:AAA family ATPase n=1 Tax=Streptomyces sp. NPDC059382 TaxID=3346816 RepID=UPI003678C07E
MSEIQVRGLLGRFDHEIAFPEADEFIILHGPNGVGKTMLLELIRALSGPLQLYNLFRVPFAEVRLGYSDGSSLKVCRRSHKQMALQPEEDAEFTTQQLLFTLSRPGFPEVPSQVEFNTDEYNSARFRDWASRILGVEAVDRDAWLIGTGEVISTVDLVYRYADKISARSPRWAGEKVALEIRKFAGQNHVHLIETQRLLTWPTPEPGEYRRSTQSVAMSKVEEFARDLARRLAEALAENSRTSQELDRTYPRRVLQVRSDAPSEEQIEQRYAEQNELRKALSAISLLDEKVGKIDIPQKMADWQRNVLWAYLEDTEKKLSTFSELLAKVSLLREIINSRFLYKTLEIDRRRGLLLKSDDRVELGLSMLSSGEQHELVLVYDLLFNVQPGALVLIDEPEISLHISWQKRFIDDLRRISQLVEFRSVVATHSPQIASRWRSRMVSLGPDADEAE